VINERTAGRWGRSALNNTEHQRARTLKGHSGANIYRAHFKRSPDRLAEIVRQAAANLRDGRIQSAREGGAINGRAVVLVDASDIPEARSRLAEAGMRIAID